MMDLLVAEYNSVLKDGAKVMAEKLREENNCMTARIKEMEQHLARKICELEVMREKFQTKKWHSFEYYSTKIGLGTASDLAASIIRELRAEIKDLKEKCEVAEENRKEATTRAQGYNEEITYLKGMLEENQRTEEIVDQEITAMRELLQVRKVALDDCRKRADRFRADLRLSRRAFERVFTEPEIRDRVSLLLSDGKGGAQQMLELNLQVVELERKVQELQVKLRDAIKAREEAELLVAAMENPPTDDPKPWPPPPTVEEVQEMIAAKKGEIASLKEQLSSTLNNKQIMRDALLELTSKNQDLVLQFDKDRELLEEVQEHLSQSDINWQAKLNKQRALRLEAERQRDHAMSLLKKDQERIKQLQRQMTAQSLLISYLQDYAAPGDSLLLKDTAVWVPRTCKSCLGPSYYSALLEVTRMERSSILMMVSQITRRLEMDRRRVTELKEAYMIQRRRAAVLQEQLKMSSQKTKFRCCNNCVDEYRLLVDHLHEERDELLIRCEELRNQNASDLYEWAELMLQQQQLYSDAIEQAEVSKRKLRGSSLSVE